MKKTVILLSILAALGGCGRHEEQAANTPQPVIKGNSIVFPDKSPQIAELRLVTAQNAGAEERSVAGRLVWDEEKTVRIFTPMAGRVSKILVEPGEKVKAGQGLANLLSSDMGTAQSDARKAQAMFEQANAQYQRAKDLAQHGVVAAKDLELAKSEMETALAERDRTMRQLAVLGANARAVDEGFQLRSPLSGVVVDRHLNPGQEAKPDGDTPAFVVTDPTHLWLQLDVAETDLRHFKVGEPVEFTVSAWPDEVFTAKVNYVSGMVDAQKRTVMVRAAVDNPDLTLKGDMFAEAQVTEAAPKGISLPDAAVFLLGQKQYVFVNVAPNTFERRQVTAELRPGGRSVITQGIKAGEKVVSDGGLLLQQLLEAE